MVVTQDCAPHLITRTVIKYGTLTQSRVALNREATEDADGKLIRSYFEIHRNLLTVVRRPPMRLTGKVTSLHAQAQVSGVQPFSNRATSIRGLCTLKPKL